MLGFSGGRKMIAPGLASQETIKAVHAPRFVREPLAAEGSIADNPVHDELVKIAAMARHDFILDVTLTRERKISGVFAGHPLKAHAAAVEFYERTSLTWLDEPADAAIACAAGYPLDLTFYQCLKGLSAAQHIVKPGGRILLLGECAEGAGSAEYARQLKSYPGHARFLESVRDAEVKIDQWQLEQIALLGLRYELQFYTPGVAKDGMGSLGAMAFGDLDEAVAALVEGLAPGARVALLPDGPYTYARAIPALA
jgi:nickel-dependent lactate racemase